MKKWLLYGVLFAGLTSFVTSDRDNDAYPVINQKSFSPGEIIEYRLNFSIFTVGRGKTIVSDQIHQFNNRPAYKVDIYGNTSGFVDWITHVEDHWGAYIDTASLLPQKTYRNILEGRYRKNEIVFFDHDAGNIEVHELDQETRLYKDPQLFKSPAKYIYDMLGGILLIRSIDFDTVQVGDTLKVNAFFQDTFYNFKTVFKGREVIKTRAGQFRALKLVPLMPENSIFEEGESSISFWISDDENKIPLLVRAEMLIGSAGVEITSFRGIRNPISSYVHSSWW